MAKNKIRNLPRLNYFHERKYYGTKYLMLKNKYDVRLNKIPKEYFENKKKLYNYLLNNYSMKEEDAKYIMQGLYNALKIEEKKQKKLIKTNY